MPLTNLDALVAANDSRLERLLRGDEAEVERLITDVAAPLVKTILSRYVRERSRISAEDANDIAGTVHLRLIGKLRMLPSSADEAVQDLEKYVAVLTYNAVNDHLRVSFPARTRLKNRLRYPLTRDRRLALWFAGPALCGGLAAWRGWAEATSEVVVPERALRGAIMNPQRPAEALVALFNELRRPAHLESIVDFFAHRWQVADDVPAANDSSEDPRGGRIKDLEDRQLLQTLWREVTELRPMQRKALLLNLRSPDSVNVVSLFVLTGITTFQELASVLEWTPAELEAVWNDLPLDDLRIAAMLGLQRQQVINLRKVARERLTRRLSRWT